MNNKDNQTDRKWEKIENFENFGKKTFKKFENFGKKLLKSFKNID